MSRSSFNEAADYNRSSDTERQEALRALLRQPLLIADRPDHGEAFAKVRRHAESLRQWFSRHTGWALEVTAECARLYKVPARVMDATHPAWVPKKEGVPFSRRAYVVLCLALAALVRSERQTTLDKIATTVVNMWREDPAFASLTFNLELADSRRDLVTALRLLTELHALSQLDGSDGQFERDRNHNVLYDVHHLIVYRLLVSRRAPAAIDEKNWQHRLEALIAEPSLDEGEQRNQRLSHYLHRRLLDDPVLYAEAADLTPEAGDYLRSQRPFILRRLVEATGLEKEDRDGGMALADPTGDCTDIGMPEEGTLGHATLLTAEHLGTLRMDDSGGIIAICEVERFLADQAKKFSKYWRRETAAEGAEKGLAREVIRRLASLDLVRQLRDGLLIMPAIHRYRLELKITTQAPSHDTV